MELMRSCISAVERVPASGGRANFGQIGRQTCLAAPVVFMLLVLREWKHTIL
jgi:hypothetical protein